MLHALAQVLLFLACLFLPWLAYVHAPRGLTEPVGAHIPPAFSVARAVPGGPPDALLVLPWARVAASPPHPAYQLPAGSYVHSFGPGAGKAEVVVEDELAGGIQVSVFVSGGEAPFSTRSVYRVRSGQVQPLRHAQSSAWIFLAILPCLWLASRLNRPMRWWLERWVGLEHAQTAQRRTSAG